MAQMAFYLDNCMQKKNNNNNNAAFSQLGNMKNIWVYNKNLAKEPGKINIIKGHFTST